jgi:hypothetical protein
MSTTERKKSAIRLETKDEPVVVKKGRYASIEAASRAKMESAKDFVANVDMTLFRKNGSVE